MCLEFGADAGGHPVALGAGRGHGEHQRDAQHPQHGRVPALRQDIRVISFI